MKTNKTTYEMPYIPKTHQLAKQNLQISDNFFLPFCLAVVMGMGFGFETGSVKAENTGALDIKHYNDPQSVGNTVGKSIQNTKEANKAKNIEVTYQEGSALKSDTGGKPENSGQAAKEPSTEKCTEPKRHFQMIIRNNHK